MLLVAQGMTCPKVSRLLGDAPRSVEYWVRRFEERGLAGLAEGQRSGRPRRLNEAQLEEVDRVLRQTPRDLGLSGTLWDGKTLSAWIEQHFRDAKSQMGLARLRMARAGSIERLLILMAIVIAVAILTAFHWSGGNWGRVRRNRA